MNGYLKRGFNNSFWLISGKVINIVIGIAVSVFVTRYLGVEQKGIMADAQAIAGFWGFLASFGLFDLLISRFARIRGESAKTAVVGILLMLLGGITAFVLSIVSALMLHVEEDVLLYVALCSSVYFFQFLSVFEYWFYSNSTSKLYAIIQSLIHAFFMALKIAAVVYNASLVYFIMFCSLETIFGFLSSLYCYKHNGIFLEGQWAFDKKIFNELFRLAAPMLIMGFATTIYMKVDQIMVGKMMGNHDLGIYSLAVNLAEYWYFVPAIIYSSFLPVITETYQDKEKFTEQLQQFADILVAISFMSIVGVMLFSRLGIEMLYGRAFSFSANVLMVYIWSGLFTCLSYSGQVVYVLEKDTTTIMWINLSGAVINFTLNYMLIGYFGSLGAALATLLQYAMIAFGQMVILKDKYSYLYKVQIKAFFPFFRLAKMLFRLIKQKREN